MSKLHHLGLLALLLTVPACGSSKAAAPAAAPETTAAAELQPGKIVFAMRGHERDFRVCFFKAPHRRGAVRVHFDVDADGIVQRSALEHSSIADAGVESCLLTQTEALRFGNVGQPYVGAWTFVFRLTEPLSEEEKTALLRQLEEEAEEDSESEEPSVVVEASSRGTLEVHQIEETVEVGFPLFARCYRDALNRRDKVGGSVKFRLAIDEHGRVTQLQDAGSKMPDPLAVDCIAEGFYAMNFPAPSGGSVSALYQLRLN